ncbi:hypothetical protein L1049_025709 [Liquidambar formosana]|uniref:DUF4094 domain-containing protein n=1 Tax=Liquidambar formosana TaxID=63359 RepID=A0AAP0R6S3_LIQFO
MAGLVAEGLKYETVVGQSADLFTPDPSFKYGRKLVSDQVLKLKQLTVLTLAERSKIKTVVVDFTGDLSEGIRKIREAIEGLDVGVLINNVGISYPYARFFHEVDDELLNNLIKVNVEGTSKVTQAVLPGMLKRKKGAIVNIGSSVANVIPSDPLYVVYAGTKGYIDQFLRCLYVEYKNSGINVQCQTAQMTMRGKSVPGKAILVLCVASFLAGSMFTSRTWTHSSHHKPVIPNHVTKLSVMAQDCDHKRRMVEGKSGDVMEEVTKTHQAIQSLDKKISTLEMELAAARTSQTGSQLSLERASNHSLQKAFVVIGINTAFSSKKRRDSVRETWMPRGGKLKKLEKEKGIIIRFVIGHSATLGSVLDKAIDAEESENKDFLRLKHVEGYHELSTKTRLYFSTAASIWDAEFYVKVDDDVHLNLGMLVSTLSRYRSEPRIYIGCMKSGPVLSQKGVKYHEPEFWKFGEEGNKYFRHATGQIYAISKDLAAYISINLPILHRYANEDVSLGSWFIGLEVKHVDDRSMCCGTPPDCEWKAQAGNVCVATFDWSCSGICKSAEKMKEVHDTCGEGDGAVWNVDL